MNIQHFIGVDISKATLDWAVYSTNGGIIYQTQSPNSETSIKATIKIIKSLPEFEITKSVCCMEHTARAAPWYLQRSFIGLSGQIAFSHLVRKQFTNQKSGRPSKRKNRCY